VKHVAVRPRKSSAHSGGRSSGGAWINPGETGKRHRWEGKGGVVFINSCDRYIDVTGEMGRQLGKARE